MPIKKTKMPHRLCCLFDRTNMQRGCKWQIVYGITVFADLQGPFDAVQFGASGHKLYKAGITNNFLSVFSSFLTDRFYRNFVNSCAKDWACTTIGVSQGSLLSALLYS